MEFLNNRNLTLLKVGVKVGKGSANGNGKSKITSEFVKNPVEKPYASETVGHV